MSPTDPLESNPMDCYWGKAELIQNQTKMTFYNFSIQILAPAKWDHLPEVNVIVSEKSGHRITIHLAPLNYVQEVISPDWAKQKMSLFVQTFNFPNTAKPEIEEMVFEIEINPNGQASRAMINDSELKISITSLEDNRLAKQVKLYTGTASTIINNTVATLSAPVAGTMEKAKEFLGGILRPFSSSSSQPSPVTQAPTTNGIPLDVSTQSPPANLTDSKTSTINQHD